MVSRADRHRQAAHDRAVMRGAVLLRPGGRGHKVRNVESGRVLPCCWADCTADGDDRIFVEVPHSQPRWRDPATGKQEMLVYIFCDDGHKAMWLKGSMYENRA
jgi:hypothetical protein